jgi:NAD(P)-dependent dehydrogenase (short-subunit alcohol dehydrogenase family)
MVTRTTGETPPTDAGLVALWAGAREGRTACHRGTAFAPWHVMNRSQQFGVLAAAGAGVALTRAWRAWPRYSFRDRSVVITGGSRGLGLEIARILTAEGASLTLIARDEDELSRARRALEGIGGPVLTVRCDVAQLPDVEAALRQVVDHHGRLDVLINCAGVIQVGPMEHMALDDYEAAMNVHFRGPLHTILTALPYMRRQHGGRIVNIASIGGKVPVPHLAPYVASKFALVGLSSSLRAELADDDILVTTVSPGLMRTGSPINASMKGQHEAEFAWFAVSDALPGLSVAAWRAARHVVEACRRGQAELIISLPAKLAAAFYGLMPSTFVTLASLANRFLPAPTGVAGDRPRLGRDSTSAWAPSRLTTLSDRAARRNNEAPRPAVS